MPTTSRRAYAIVGMLALTASLVVAGAGAVQMASAQSVSTTFDFEGGGWGHGVGMSQWGAKGRADAGQSAPQILAAYYQNTQLTSQSLGNLRVHLATIDSTTFTLSGAITWLVNGVAKAQSPAGDTVAVRAVGDSIRIQTMAPAVYPEIVLGGAADVVSVTLKSGEPVLVGATGNHYHAGRLVIRRAATNQLQITLDSLTMQAYLYGIAEVPASWPVEALRAQAIAARTYAAMRLRSPQSDTFDIYATTQDQNYTGWDKESSDQAARWIAAVNDTNQQIVTYNGAPISAFYFSSSGGATENSEYVFVDTLPYARSIADPFDNAVGNSNFRWKRSYAGIELGAWLKTSRAVDVGSVTKLDFLGPFGASGRIDRSLINVTGTNGTTQITGGQLMAAINANAPNSRQMPSSLVFIKPNGSFDAAVFAPGGVRVAGWTYYPYAGASARVQVTVDGNVAGDVVASGARGDVAAAIPGAPANAGFDTIVPIQNETSTVCLNAHLPNNSMLFSLGCKSVTVPTQPFGSLDVAVNTGNSLRVSGWAVDPQTQGLLEIHVYVDGQISGLVANRERSDLAPYLPGWGTSHGFDGVVAAAPGLHNVCVYAINVGPGSHVLVGCRSVQVLPPHATRPIGSFDTLASVDGSINLAGWALDPDTADPIDVHVYIDGVLAGGTPANRSRTDVGAVFPAYGARHGFEATFAATPGAHTVCAYAINDGPPDHTLLACRSLVVIARDAPAPFGSLDVIARSGTTLHRSGRSCHRRGSLPIRCRNRLPSRRPPRLRGRLADRERAHASVRLRHQQQRDRTAHAARLSHRVIRPAPWSPRPPRTTRTPPS
ncbi:MAG: SpoIID/LytB domain-containing protein [Actinobacteria bacterium]|nr:MAG: SpoIID/LytB domain-containing protein [Actinomycetota bacterium]